MKSVSIQCDSCRFWRRGDITQENIGNIGVCVWTNENEKAPWWAKEVFRRTISWEGQSCRAYEVTSKQQIAKNRKF